MSKFWATGTRSTSSSDDSTYDDDSDTDSDRTVGSLGFSSFGVGEDDYASDTAALRQMDLVNESFSAAVTIVDTSEVSSLTRGASSALPVDDPRVAWARARPTQKFLPPPRRTGPPDPSRYTRIACVSDTHGYHRNIAIPNCDVLIHGGDFTNFGEPEMVKDVSRYFGELLAYENGGGRGAGGAPRAGSVVCIAGNHELTFQPDHYEKVWRHFHHPENGPYDCRGARESLENCTYLEDESCYAGGGENGLRGRRVKMYGSPWQPEYHRWAFNLPRSEIGDKWRKIPNDADVLITHGPPLGRGDRCSDGQRAGCLELMRHVQDRVKPRLHVFGHVHEGAGHASSDGTTLYVNASSVGRNYEKHHPCVVVDLPHDLSLPAVLVDPSADSMSQEDIREWLRRNGHGRLVPFFERQEVSAAYLIEPDNFGEVCCLLGLHRSADAVADLKLAVTALRAFMYG